MNTTNPPAATVMARIYHYFSGHDSSIGHAAAAHHSPGHPGASDGEGRPDTSANGSSAKAMRRRAALDFVTQQPKFVTLIQLIANSVTFIMYFFAVGLVLQEFQAST